jgi:hypothetical protein
MKPPLQQQADPAINIEALEKKEVLAAVGTQNRRHIGFKQAG